MTKGIEVFIVIWRDVKHLVSLIAEGVLNKLPKTLLTQNPANPLLSRTKGCEMVTGKE